MNAQGNSIVRRRGRAKRVAIALALLAASLLFASSASAATLRSEFYGIVQTATLDPQDELGMQAANVHVNRFILNWVWVEPTQGHFDWGSSDRFIGELASRGIRSLPSVWGNPDWVAGGAATPPTGGTKAQQQWRNLLKALVNALRARWDYWATKYHQQFGATADAAADHRVADLERAEREEVLHPLPLARAVRAAAADLHAHDQEHRSARAGRASPACRATGTSPRGTSSRSSTR